MLWILSHIERHEIVEALKHRSAKRDDASSWVPQHTKVHVLRRAGSHDAMFENETSFERDGIAKCSKHSNEKSLEDEELAFAK